jgi:fatty acid desaturase
MNFSRGNKWPNLEFESRLEHKQQTTEVMTTTLESSEFYIHGKQYDLSNFKHPGGPVALSLAADRDATQLFESYHPFSTHVKSVLAKYEVKSEKPLDELIKSKAGEEIFDWSTPSEFMNEIKERVHPIFKQAGTHYADNVRWMQMIGLWIPVLLMLRSFVNGEWWTLILFPLAVWICGVNIFHDASHMAISKNWRVNQLLTYLFPFFSSPFTWAHQHVIGHHVYTNIHRKDPDLHHGKFLWRLHPQVRYYNWYQWQKYYTFAIWTIVTGSLAFIIDIAFMEQGTYHNMVKMVKITSTRKKLHYLGRLFTFCLVFVWPFCLPWFSFKKALIWSIVPYVIFSCCFSFCSQLNHLTDENSDKFNKDFYVHQVLTSHTFAPQSLVWFIFTGGLNLQIEHHLFPGVNQWHLRKIQPIVEEVCNKYNVHYTVSRTASEAVGKYIAHLANMGSKVKAE